VRGGRGDNASAQGFLRRGSSLLGETQYRREASQCLHNQLSECDGSHGKLGDFLHPDEDLKGVGVYNRSITSDLKELDVQRAPPRMR
jgi:hypothetical protein